MISEKGKTAHLSYDPEENILYFSFPNVSLTTRRQIIEHFDWNVGFWKRHCGGKKAYIVIDYDGCEVDPKHTALYAEQIKRVMACAITIVRYGGSALQRTTARLANMKLHKPSRLYASREEALAVVRAIKAGDLQAIPPDSQG